MNKKYKVVAPEFWKEEFPNIPWFFSLLKEPNSMLTMNKCLVEGDQVVVLGIFKQSIEIQTEDGVIGWTTPNVFQFLKECIEI